MKISCPTCAAKYSVADEKIQTRLAKIRCRKCSSTIVIDGTASPAKVYVGDASTALSASGPPQDLGTQDMGIGDAPGSTRPGASAAAPGAAEPVGPAPDEYAVDIADNDQRNMTIHQIVGAYNEGLVTADTYIWKEGMADWQTLAEVKEVADALHAAARPAATPAAVRRGDHNSSADLFGRIHTAGSEDDITTSAPEPPPAMTAGTGARNESSVLFSLSALTGTAAAPSAPSSTAKRRNTEDSGLIDLQALTATENAGGTGGLAGPGAFGASPLISAPLGGVAGPALGGGLMPGYGEQRSGSRTGLVIAGLALAVAIIGGAAFVVNRGSGESERPTSSLDRAGVSASPEPTVPSPKPAEPAPAPAGSEEAEAPTAAGTTRPVAAEDLPPVAEEAPPKPARPAPRPSTPRPSRPAAASKPALPPAPVGAPEPAPKPAPKASGDSSDAPKKKAAPRCDCKPSDLLCAMKCSAKR